MVFNSYPIIYIVEENRRNLDEFEYTSINIKSSLNSCKDRLKERTEKIAIFGYYSKERISNSKLMNNIYRNGWRNQRCIWLMWSRTVISERSVQKVLGKE